jgi:hypothetical protein
MSSKLKVIPSMKNNFKMKEYLRLRHKFFNGYNMTDEEILELGELLKVIEQRQKIDVAKKKNYTQFKWKRFDR